MSERPAPAVKAPDRSRDLLRLLKTLSIGAVGGAAFAYLRMPLAWMMGAMVFTIVVALSGRELQIPGGLRSTMIVILGVLVGSSFTPEVMTRVGQWPLTLGCLAVYLVVVIAILYQYFTRVLGFDRATAYFSSAPGGFTEMLITGSAMGADDRTVALIHGGRVVLVVLTIPFWFRYTTGVITSPSDIGSTWTSIDGADLAILVACGIVGALAGKLLRLPAYRLSGPMLASAGVHLGGITSSAPPFELVAAAQIVLGSAVGARFVGVPLARVFRTLGASVGSTALILACTVAFAFGLSPVTGYPWPPLVLAFSPGGLTEMTLIALSLGIETAFVATHHLVRIGLIVVVAPLLFRHLAGRERP